MSFIKNYSFSLFIQVTNLIIPFITTPYLVRVLGKNGWGEVVYVNIIVQYFILLCNFGIVLFGNRLGSAVRSQNLSRSYVFLSLALIQISVSGISIMMYLFYVQFYANEKILYILASGQLFAAMIDFTWYLQSISYYKIIAVSNIIVKIINMVCFFAFIDSANNGGVYFLIISITNIIGSILLLPSILKSISILRFRIKFNNQIKHFVTVLPLFFTQLIMVVYSSVDRLMLNSRYGNEELGKYDAINRIIMVLSIGIVSVRPLLISNISTLFSQNNFKKIKCNITKTSMVLLFVSIPISFLLFSISSILIPLYYGEGFSDAVDIAMILSFIISLTAMGDIFVNQLMVALNKDKQYLFTIIIMLSLIVSLNYLLMPTYGIYGTAFSTLIAHIVILFVEYYFVGKFILLNSLLKETSKIILASFTSTIITVLLKTFFHINLMGLFSIILIWLTVFLIIFIILKPRVLTIIISQLPDSLHKFKFVTIR